MMLRIDVTATRPLVPFRDYYIAHHAYVHNKRAAERKLHKQLEKIASDRRGEWFKASVEDAVDCITGIIK